VLCPCQLLDLGCPVITSIAQFDEWQVTFYWIWLLEVRYLIRPRASSPPFHNCLASNFDPTWMLVSVLDIYNPPLVQCSQSLVFLKFLTCNITMLSNSRWNQSEPTKQGKLKLDFFLLAHQKIVPTLPFVIVLWIFLIFFACHFVILIFIMRFQKRISWNEILEEDMEPDKTCGQKVK